MPIIVGEDEFTINSFDVERLPPYKSLLHSLNKMLHMYLYTCMDDGANKFYAPLIENFATSAASAEVMQSRGVPNVKKYAAIGLADAQAARDDRFQAPLPDSVIYTSNAIIIRSLLNSVASIGLTQRKRFLFESLGDIPEYLKERMKVNLPMFANMFNIIADRALFLKNILLNTNLKLVITSDDARNAAARFDNYVEGAVTNLNVQNTKDQTSYYTSQLSKLYDCAQSLRKSADSVYRELADRPPVFLETSKDFLVDYRNRFGGNPVMPFSSILVSLNLALERFDGRENLLLPTRENGSNAYKFNYATRLILNKHDLDISLDHFVGAKELYNNYAANVSSNVLISQTEYTKTIKHTFALAKHLINTSSEARVVSSSFFLTPEANFGLLDARAKIHFRITTNKKRSTSLNKIISLTENNNINISKERIAKIVDPEQAGTNNIDRANMQVLNILDADIVPLNVHAFMREVPFVNLLNYSYTFDRMIHDFITPKYIQNQLALNRLDENSILLSRNDNVSSTREMLVKLLIYPYANIDANEQYFGILASLFNGNDDMKLGRPRYLSDQLWHKNFLTSSVQLADNQDDGRAGFINVPALGQEAGPAGAEAARFYTRGIPPGVNDIGINTQAVDTEGLKILENGKWKVATATPMPPNDVLYCAELGKLRFDTRLARNLTWFVHLQRIIRVVLTNHLSWVNSPVVRGLKIANSSVTEFNANQQFDDNDYTGDNYDLV